jgi:UTP--glucose-1-phosphate uridylyltransferase
VEVSKSIIPKAVRKAVFPVAGLGTRILPATKTMPKEMLTIVDKPLIHYAMEETKAAGIEQFYFVTGRAISAIEDHFDLAFELEATLRYRGKSELLDELQEWRKRRMMAALRREGIGR